MTKDLPILEKAIKYLTHRSLFLIIFQCICVTTISANDVRSQGIEDKTISIQLVNSSLRSALLEIEAKSGIKFVFNDQLISKSFRITATFTKEKVSNILIELLKDTGLSFKEMNQNVVIRKKPAPGIIGLIPKVEQNSLDPYLTRIPMDISISGTVTSDEDGFALPGVNIIVKGTSMGTITDIDGNYTLIVPSIDSEIIFSSVGYISEEVLVGSKTIINISLTPDLKTLGEVVVTSFGIKKDKKALGYSVQEVSGENITETNQPNIANALQGKVAGMQITNSGGVPGASSSIILRGGTSIDGDNQPLFVVDGIPIDNSTIAEPIGGSGQLARTVSNTNRAMDLNPEDVESISVLKGPAAAALYGLRAASGAIIITTKKGKSGKGKLNYSNSFEINRYNKLPVLQNNYKQGNNSNPGVTNFSWGPEFNEGEEVYNNLKDFFQYGSIQNHNLSFSGGNEKTTFYTSAARFDQDGIVPGSGYDRTSFRLNAESKVLDKLLVGASVNYSFSSAVKPLQGQGVVDGSGGIILGAINWPRNDNMSIYLAPDGSHRNFGIVDNPYWSTINNPVNDNVNRFTGMFNISYDAFDWLNVSYRLGRDFYNQENRSLRSPGTTLVGNENGGLFDLESFYQITTSNLLLNFKKKLTKDIDAKLLVGNNVEWINSRSTSLFGTDFNNPDFIGFRNTDNVISDKVISQRRIVGAFGNLEVNYKEILYLSVTGRNDWSSTLPKKNRSFFYPSVGGSLVFSELLNLNESPFSFGKIRATWAKVGKDAPPHKLASSLENNIGVGGGFKFGFFGNNSNIKPETTTSFEIGTDLRFFDGRFGVDFTYYTLRSEDQIIQPRVSQGTGFIFLLVNGGTIENKGYEVMLQSTPISTANFSWNINVNWSHNQSKLVNLPAELPVFVQSDAITRIGLAQGASYVGNTFYGLLGSSWKTTTQGEVIIGSDGYPIVESNINLLADREPDWIAGITNRIDYKNLELSFLFDFRIGGDVFNGTEYELVRSGLSTLTNNRNTSKVIKGVIDNGDGTYSPNDKEVILDQNYYQNIYANNARNFIEDGSWIRLRYLTLQYSLPKAIISKTPFTNFSVQITGKNLWLITNYSGMDPELSSGGAGVRGTGTNGIDYVGVPSTKGISIGINLGL